MIQNQAAPVRIAVAEDEPDIRKTFVRLLELLGHQVVFAVANGAELLEQKLDDRVDVVFVDLDMPVMDGLAAAEEVDRKGIPVILVSGHPDSESVVLDQEPVVARIAKPASSPSPTTTTGSGTGPTPPPGMPATPATSTPYGCCAPTARR